MSGLLAFIGGAARGGADVLEDKRKARELEVRERRLREFKIEMADRAVTNARTQRREIALETYGEGANLSGGTNALAIQSNVNEQSAMMPGAAEQARMTAEAQGEGQSARDARLQQERIELQNLKGQQAQAAAQAGGQVGGLKDTDMRAIYDRHRQRVIEGVAPAGDVALGAMIQKHGGWEGWSEAYTQANAFPDYLSWREDVFGVPNPDASRSGAEPGAAPARPAGAGGGFGGVSGTPDSSPDRAQANAPAENPQGLLSLAEPQRPEQPQDPYTMAHPRPEFANEQAGRVTRTPAQWGRDFADDLRSRSPARSTREYQRPDPAAAPDPSGAETPADRAIRSIRDPQAQEEARAVLAEAQEALAARPDRRAQIEQQLADALRQLGASL